MHEFVLMFGRLVRNVLCAKALTRRAAMVDDVGTLTYS